MAGPPAFQFYAADWIAATRRLSAAARGAYITMLCDSWESGPIPDNPDAIARAMGLTPYDPGFAVIWAELAPKWTLKKTGWIDQRLEKIRAEQETFRRAKSEAGRLSGLRRRELSAEQTLNKPRTEPRTNAEQNHEQTGNEIEPSDLRSSISDLRSPLSDLHPPISTLQDQGTQSARATPNGNPHHKPTNLINGAFVDFWHAYPRKTNKHAASKAWQKLHPTPELQAVIQAALGWQTAQPKWREKNGEYIPHASTWLNNRRWEDETPTAPVNGSSSLRYDWRTECIQLHGDRCGSATFHAAKRAAETEAL